MNALPAHLRRGPDLGPPVGPGRVYSVFDWVTMSYDYYYDPAGPAAAGGWVARPGPAATPPWRPHGDPIENLLAELPAGAVPIGRGPQAWGEVAVKDRAAALAGRVGLGEGTPGYSSLLPGALGSFGEAPGNEDTLAGVKWSWALVLLGSVLTVRWLVK